MRAQIDKASCETYNKCIDIHFDVKYFGFRKVILFRETEVMKTGNLSAVYGVIALLSVLLCAAYFIFDKSKNRLFLSLFACVSASNSGYFLLSVCDSLQVARIANGISYFGGAFSLLVMEFIIYDVCQLRRRKWFYFGSLGICIAVFLTAASADLFGLYYKSISLESVNGTTRLVKEYGLLHRLYAVYLFVCILAMLLMIVYAAKTKRLHSPKYTLFLLVAVLLNVCVWLIEQVVSVQFEFLSVSYVITAVLLFLIYSLLCDYGIISPEEGVVSVQMLTQLNTHHVEPGALPEGMEAMFRKFAEKCRTLSSAERRILNYYIEGYEIAEVPELAFISINTVKKHNRSIYQKLEISSRDELMLYIELFRCCGRLGELTLSEAASTDMD